MSDAMEFKSSFDEHGNEMIFAKKEVLKLPDNNNGSYPQSQIIFNLASISNNDMFLALKESYLEIPFVVNLSSSANLDGVAKNAYACAIKGGFHNLINQISVTIDNNNCINFTDLTNIPIHYKLLTEFGQDDLQKMGDVLNFAKDSVDSLNYSGVTGTSGFGEYNNVIKPTTFDPATGYGKTDDTQNIGLLQRAHRTAYDPTSSCVSVFSNSAQTSAKRKSHYYGASVKSLQWHVMATVPLGFLSDLFNNMPLVRGLYMKLVLSCNTGSAEFKMESNGNISEITASSQYQMFPFMIAQGAGGLYNATNGNVVTVSCGVVSAGGAQTVFDKTCYFNACMYKFTASYEDQYLKEANKTVSYTDYITKSQLAIPAGNQLNLEITSGMNRVRGLLICTYLARSVNGSATVNGAFAAGNPSGAYSVLDSPFTSAPCTTMKGTSWTNFNVKVGGINHYANPVTYSYDHYLNEIARLGLNGGLSNGIGSGLISQTEFESGGYQFIYVDLSRKVDSANDEMNKSVIVTATNNSNATVDVITFLSYEKEITINKYTGKLVLEN